MEKTIIVDGYRFTVTSGKKYYYNSSLRKYLHQYIWIKEYGEIPKGHEVHHIDLNPFNNSLENLRLLTIEEHKKIHADVSWDEDRRKWARENLAQNARPKASEWHKSDEGREWHKKHFEHTKDKLFQEKEFICECCKEPFKAVNKGVNRFCSNRCKSKWRRDKGLDNESRVCENCGKEFIVNKYSKVKNCSRSCSMIRRHNESKDSPNLQEKQL